MDNKKNNEIIDFYDTESGLTKEEKVKIIRNLREDCFKKGFTNKEIQVKFTYNGKHLKPSNIPSLRKEYFIDYGKDVYESIIIESIIKPYASESDQDSEEEQDSFTVSNIKTALNSGLIKYRNNNKPVPSLIVRSDDINTICRSLNIYPKIPYRIQDRKYVELNSNYPKMTDEYLLPLKRPLHKLPIFTDFTEGSNLKSALDKEKSASAKEKKVEIIPIFCSVRYWTTNKDGKMLYSFSFMPIGGKPIDTQIRPFYIEKTEAGIKSNIEDRFDPDNFINDNTQPIILLELKALEEVFTDDKLLLHFFRQIFFDKDDDFKVWFVRANFSESDTDYSESISDNKHSKGESSLTKKKNIRLLPSEYLLFSFFCQIMGIARMTQAVEAMFYNIVLSYYNKTVLLAKDLDVDKIPEKLTNDFIDYARENALNTNQNKTILITLTPEDSHMNLIRKIIKSVSNTKDQYHLIANGKITENNFYRFVIGKGIDSFPGFRDFYKALNPNNAGTENSTASRKRCQKLYKKWTDYFNSKSNITWETYVKCTSNIPFDKFAKLYIDRDKKQ